MKNHVVQVVAINLSSRVLILSITRRTLGIMPIADSRYIIIYMITDRISVSY